VTYTLQAEITTLDLQSVEDCAKVFVRALCIVGCIEGFEWPNSDHRDKYASRANKAIRWAFDYPEAVIRDDLVDFLNALCWQVSVNGYSAVEDIIGYSRDGVLLAISQKWIDARTAIIVKDEPGYTSDDVVADPGFFREFESTINATLAVHNLGPLTSEQSRTCDAWFENNPKITLSRLVRILRDTEIASQPEVATER